MSYVLKIKDVNKNKTRKSQKNFISKVLGINIDNLFSEIIAKTSFWHYFFKVNNYSNIGCKHLVNEVIVDPLKSV